MHGNGMLKINTYFYKRDNIYNLLVWPIFEEVLKSFPCLPVDNIERSHKY